MTVSLRAHDISMTTCVSRGGILLGMKPRAFLLTACLLSSATAAFADGLIVIHHAPPGPLPPRRPWPPPHPWPIPIPHPVFAPLEVAYHKVDVTIDGQKATTRVDQEFVNPNNAR